MIKPSDIIKSPSSRLSDNRYWLLCEADFDCALQRSEITGRWPAIVYSVDDEMPDHIVTQVADQYRAEGWVVTLGTGGVRADHRRHAGVRAEIDVKT